MIWFTSDLHFGHNSVLKFSNRPFKDVHEMNEVLIKNFNMMVNKNDTVYLLGDVAYRIPVEQANELIKRLNGKKILIRGNHDKKYDESLFEGIYDYFEINYNKIPFVLMHYPMLEWKKSRRGSIQLHGHIHSEGMLYNEDCKMKGIRRYDVGVDANDYFPISIKQIIEYFNLEDGNWFINWEEYTNSNKKSC